MSEFKLSNLKIEYEQAFLPIRKASFRASGGMNVEVFMRNDQKRIQITHVQSSGNVLCASFNKHDLGEYIKLLQHFHDRLIEDDERDDI
jgi:hypothetical protein